jgi:PAS domain S-box-containing protein
MLIFFPFLASVIFLKGRLIGFIYLVMVSATLIIFRYFIYDIYYSDISLLLTSSHVLMFYLIISLYEHIRYEHSSVLNTLVDKSYIQNQKLKYIMKSFNKYTIFSKTDLSGKITYANEAFCNVSGYTKKELVGQPHNIIRHKDMPKETFEKLWKDIKEKKYWHGEIKNKNKNGSFYWLDSIIEADYDSQGNHIGYHAIRQNITAKKEIEILKENLYHTNENLEDQVNEKIIEVIQLNKEIIDTQKEIIFTMGVIGESRSKETANHVKRVAEYSKLLATYIGMDSYKAELIKQASPMHDMVR